METEAHPGKRIGLVDERSEIAGCLHGIPQNDLGIRTDVLDGCPKVEGMMLLIRSMAPEILAVDEIGGREDFCSNGICHALWLSSAGNGTCRKPGRTVSKARVGQVRTGKVIQKLCSHFKRERRTQVYRI